MSLNYAALKDIRNAKDRRRCAERLLAMRKSLKTIRERKGDHKLLLATWNIRDFDDNRYKWGPRLPESFFYLAEMISAFDLVAVQEVNRDLAPLRKLLRILGREWEYIVTDVTAGRGGNDERMAYIYNKEKVFFRRIAGEIVLPDGQLIVSEKTQASDDGVEEIVKVEHQFARTPYLVAFQSGWFKFSLCTVHIYFGANYGQALKRRIAAIRKLAEFFAHRQDKDNKQTRDELGNVENYILLGDFNVISPEHKTMQALKSNDFKVPPQIDGARIPSQGDFERPHYYDQIAVRVMDPRFRVVDGGIVNMFKDVFRETDEDRRIYSSKVKKKDPEKKAQYRAKNAVQRYKKWRTWQMSDHFPLWIEIETDYSEHYLKEIVADS